MPDAAALPAPLPGVLQAIRMLLGMKRAHSTATERAMACPGTDLKPALPLD